MSAWSASYCILFTGCCFFKSLLKRHMVKSVLWSDLKDDLKLNQLLLYRALKKQTKKTISKYWNDKQQITAASPHPL